MLVIAPLITGGALTALLAFFGLRLPSGIERALGLGAKAMSGDSVGLVGEALRMAGGLGSAGGKVSVERGHGPGGASWERRHWEQDLSYGDDEYGFGRSASGGGSWGSVVGGLGGLGGVAKMFL